MGYYDENNEYMVNKLLQNEINKLHQLFGDNGIDNIIPNKTRIFIILGHGYPYIRRLRRVNYYNINKDLENNDKNLMFMTMQPHGRTGTFETYETLLHMFAFY